MRTRPKVIVLGLDCADPDLVFEQWLPDLPHIRQVLQKGVYARMRSSDPPITVPAWASMMTGKDPGQLGIYGFRNRTSYDYGNVEVVDSTILAEPTVWDVLGEKGYQSVLMGVPPSYPPQPIEGHLISCFLTPDRSVPYTYPTELASEIEREVGEYLFDVTHFRTDQTEELLNEIYEVTKMRFKTAQYLLTNKPWDFFMMVEMGIDRIQHACWHWMDEKHVLYQPSSYQQAIYEYYRYIDEEIGKLLALIPPETRVFIVSDHGAKRMDGGFCLNEWLIREGYLKLKQPVEKPTPLRPEMVDWSRTQAWGDGGYYGRLCLNIRGREPQGIIPPSKVKWVLKEIIQKLKTLTDEQGNPLHTKVIRPSKRYQAVKNIPPDLLIYFGDLYWRSVGQVGVGQLYVYENDTGPDGANHDYEGIFISSKWDEEEKEGRELPRLHLMDMAPTILRQFGIAPLKGMQGKVISLG